MLRSKRNRQTHGKSKTCYYGCCSHGMSKKVERRYLRRVEKQEIRSA